MYIFAPFPYRDDEGDETTRNEEKKQQLLQKG